MLISLCSCDIFSYDLSFNDTVNDDIMELCQISLNTWGLEKEERDPKSFFEKLKYGD